MIVAKSNVVIDIFEKGVTIIILHELSILTVRERRRLERLKTSDTPVFY
jgi:hypothetical protein